MEFQDRCPHSSSDPTAQLWGKKASSLYISIILSKVIAPNNKKPRRTYQGLSGEI